jgi:hypothetical protein
MTSEDQLSRIYDKLDKVADMATRTDANTLYLKDSFDEHKVDTKEMLSDIVSSHKDHDKRLRRVEQAVAIAVFCVVATGYVIKALAH